LKVAYKTHRCSDITSEIAGTEVVLAGWVHRIRDLGSKKFIILRDGGGTVQVVASKNDLEEVSWRTVEELSPESVVQIRGVVRADPRAPGGVEVHAKSVVLLNRALPLPLDVSGKTPADLDTRLRERILDLRRDEMQAVFRIADTVLRVIRDFLRQRGFIEIFTPKIIAAATEGGANLFPVVYFGREAFLAQSPQLYKELLASVFERVFEIGPAWRAEESDTPYHLAEFISVDIEMAFADYNDVMRLLEELLKEIVTRVKDVNQNELKILRYSPPEIKLPLRRLTYLEALEILKSRGLNVKFGDDLGTPELRIIADELKEDVYFIVDFPTLTRPFYTKPKSSDQRLSESFDLVWRHLEIASGSTRIHEKQQLIESLKQRGLNPQSFEFFIKWFDYGMPPHAGWGLGFARLMLMLTGRSNVREVTLFPRDFKRLVP